MVNGQKRLNECISKEQKYIKSREYKVSDFMFYSEKYFKNLLKLWNIYFYKTGLP
jgi:hypothetical protein